MATNSQTKQAFNMLKLADYSEEEEEPSWAVSLLPLLLGRIAVERVYCTCG